MNILKSKRFLDYTFVALTLVFGYFQLRQAQSGEWGDESETIVVSRMIHGGEKLYSSIFNHHGPATFFVPWLTEIFGPQTVFVHRLPVIVLQVALLILIYKSQVHETKSKALQSTAVLAIFLGYLSPSFLGNTMQYQTLAGLAVSTIFIIWVWPRLLLHKVVNPSIIFIGAFLSVSLFFLAFIYLPVTVAIALVTFERKRWLLLILAHLAAVGANLIWIFLVGDLNALIVDHFYFNSVVMRPYFGGTETATYVMAIINMVLSKPSLVFAVIAATLIVVSNLPREGTSRSKSVILMLAFATILIRGDDFHASPYFYVLATVLALVIPRLGVGWTKIIKGLWLAALILLCTRFLGVLPGDQQYWESRAIPTTSELSELIGGLTEEDDRVIIYTFRNFEYLIANRLPASPSFFYFPWQADYEKKPILDVEYDTCGDLKRSKPKVISLDRWTVWGAYPWNTYGQCIDQIVENQDNYFETHIPGTYARVDLRAKYEEFRLRVSQPG